MALTENGTYLGNGAYCDTQLDSSESDNRKLVILYTKNSGGVVNTVYLGPAEVKALLVWLESQNFIPNPTQDCHNCDGFGQIRESRKCAVCNGSGKR